MSGDPTKSGETFSESETEDRREKILKQLLGSKAESQKTVAEKARRRRHPK